MSPEREPAAERRSRFLAIEQVLSVEITRWDAGGGNKPNRPVRR
jgi:hypothetical protein